MTRDIPTAPASAPALDRPVAPALPVVSAPVSRRYAGLDGLRAIAVALVVAYHLFPAWWLPQGFIGVDVFFVISGFLITSLLLHEAASSEAAGRGRRISLVGFWRRRARRLLPALVTLIVVCGLWAWTIGGDVLVGFGRQVLGALTFSFNWISISAGSGYFDAGTPELFRNLWSLAVEEQFYVLWPLLFPLLLLIPSRVVRAGVAVVAAAGSALWMAVLVSNALAGTSGGGANGVGVTRAYFGTDSHGFGILLGVALAFVAGQALRTPTAWMLRAHVRRGVTALGALAVAGIVAIATVPPAPDTATFPGALLVACLLTVVAITAGAWPGSVLGRALDLAPLRFVGQRSYGIYLWHWPVLVLLMAGLSIAPGTEVPLAVGLWALAITLFAAIVSYRFIETPIRRNGFRASFAALRARLSGAPAGRFAALAAVTAFVIAAGATTSAIAIAPEVTSGATAVEAGQQALDSADAPSQSRSPSPSSSSGPRVEPPLAVQTGDEPVPGPRPTPVTGDQVSAIGDSVMLASAPGLMERMPGIQIDASVSRSLNAGVGIAEAQAAAGQLRPYVVIALGTNGPISAEALARLEQAIGPDRHLVLVNAFAPRDWIAGVNSELATFDAAQANVVVADWAGAAAAHQDLLAGDRIHPGPTGGKLFAETVASAVQGVENARAQAAFDRSVRASALASRLVDGDGDGDR
ncbi:MAG: acyltransferase family protein [Microbacterium sp.]|uniref:acyltransferase family protein n=1 Tax=Microbacterium sp. TaxID=51671 RepID=UPI0027253B33|nr:acyltransferase family protein [Microbacterium sp.]MDO8383306.1 acyltransferase family protein [Microbacterium sp.]